MPEHRTIAVALGALLVCAVACGQDPGPDRGADTRPEAGPVATAVQACVGSTARQISDLWSLSRADYEPVDDVVDLAGTADLVLAGTVRRVVDGRIDRDDSGGGFALRSVGVGITPTVVAKAPTRGIPDDVVWFETTRGAMPIDDFADRLPPGTPVAVYAVEAREGGRGYSLDRRRAGYPDGARLWEPMGPQALLFGYCDPRAPSDGGVVTPETGEVAPGRDVEDFLPSTEAQ